MRNVHHKLMCSETRSPVSGAVEGRFLVVQPCWRKYIGAGRL